MLRMVLHLMIPAGLLLVAMLDVAAAQQTPPPQANLVQPPAQNAPAVRVPFQLTPAEAAYVDQVLRMWEVESGKIKTFKCPFDHLKYEAAFADKKLHMYENKGVLIYERPDKGTFKIEQVGVWNGKWGEEAAWPVKKDAYGEHFVCDGEKVYIYNHRAKQLEISPIPAELRGKRIVDGPLPFLFGADAAKIKHRYWVRITDSNEEELWLDARPKFAEDASSYKQVEVILDRKELLPKAIKVYRPNGDEDVYIFGEANVNDPLFKIKGLFEPPRRPLGWDVVEHPLPQQPPDQPLPRDAQRQRALPRY